MARLLFAPSAAGFNEARIAGLRTWLKVELPYLGV